MKSTRVLAGLTKTALVALALTAAACSSKSNAPADNAPTTEIAKTEGEVVGETSVILKVEAVAKFLSKDNEKFKYTITDGVETVELSTNTKGKTRTAMSVTVGEIVYKVEDVCTNGYCVEVVALITRTNAASPSEVIQTAVLMQGKDRDLAVVQTLQGTSYETPIEAYAALVEAMNAGQEQQQEEQKQEEQKQEEQKQQPVPATSAI